jgi:heme exporter protein D
MTPFFQTWQEFFNMGGYGFYVWLCYAITVVALIILAFSSFAEKNQILKWVAKEQQRQQRVSQNQAKTKFGDNNES